MHIHIGFAWVSALSAVGSAIVMTAAAHGAANPSYPDTALGLLLLIGWSLAAASVLSVIFGAAKAS